jgi:hypothetical protein
MDVIDTLSLEKQSQGLIKLLEENWKEKGLYFNNDYHGIAQEYSTKHNPLYSTQKTLDWYYIDDWLIKWDNYRIDKELVEHIQFVHKNQHNLEIFKKHQADVLELLENLNSLNKSAIKKKSSDNTFWHLDPVINFWNDLSEIHWNVKEIDFDFFLNSNAFRYMVFNKSHLKQIKANATVKYLNYYCYELLFYALGRDGSINKISLCEDFAKNIPIPLGNLFVKGIESKLYYRYLLEKSLNILTSYGFFIREKKKGKEDSFHPTLFLKIHKDIYTKGIKINQGFFDLEAISLNKFSTNYFNLLDIKKSNENNQILLNLQKYINKLSECDKANFTLSQLHSAHKLAANESGIVLLKKY